MPDLTPELVTDGLTPDDLRVSPDGRLVAYTVAPVGMKEEHPTRTIWIAATDGSAPPRRLTAGTAEDSRPRWAADGRSLYFLSDRKERGKAQLQRIAIDGGEAEALTEWKTGIAGFEPLPNGATVAFWAKDEPTEEDERREKERDDARVWGERLPFARLRLFDTATRQIRTVDGLTGRHIDAVAVRPNDGLLAVATWSQPERDPGWLDAEIWLVEPRNGSARRFATTPHAGMQPTWRQTADGWHLTCLGFRLPFLIGAAAIFDLPMSDGPAPEPRDLTAGLAACPAALAGTANGEVLALVAEGLDTSIQRLDRNDGRLVRLIGLPGEAGAISASADGRVVALLRSTATEPLDVWAGPPSGPFKWISDTRPELREITWGSQERLSWTAADGLALDGLLILPPGKNRADGPFPTITLVHGGPYGRFADDFQLGAMPSGQWLATAGYAVFLPNPRGGMGHGHDFAVRSAGAVGKEDWLDIVAGLDRLIDEHVANPDRLGIGGWSQGGFMSAWAVGQTDRFKAAVVGAGPTDWGMMAATSDVPHFEAALGGSWGWESIGAHPHDAISPISFAHRVTTPVLILHGEQDKRVPVSQAEFFHRALQERGVPHEYVVYPREPHGIRERNHQLDMLRRVRAWYERWLMEGISADI